MSLVEMHPLRKDESLSDGTPVMSTSILGNRLSFTNHEGSTSFHSTSVHGLFSKVLVQSYHLSQIVDIYIHIASWAFFFSLRDAIRDKLLEENTLCRFPYEEETVKKWIPHNVSDGDRHPRRKIHVLNLNEESGPYPNIDGAVFPPSGRGAEDGFTILCHGTNHESAVNIIEQGIDLNMLREDIAGDFSDKTGFYMTEFEKARHWGFSCKSRIHSSRPKKVAVLVFKIPNEEIDVYRPESLNLMGQENEERWRAFVTSTNIALEIISFVEGPWIRRGRYAVMTDQQVPDSYQMCVLKEEMAEMIDRHLHCVVFYNTIRRGPR